MGKIEILKSPEVRTRQELALLCNARKFWRAAEVGVDIGLYCQQFNERWRGEYYFAVDPFEPYEEMPYDRSGDLQMFIGAVQRFHPRVKLVRARSPEAAKLLPTWINLEFAYIDGSHVYENVIKDMFAWWDRLYDGETILAGHDFYSGHRGVMVAVEEFARARNRNVYLTDEEIPSWYMYKNEPKQLMRMFA